MPVVTIGHYGMRDSETQEVHPDTPGCLTKNALSAEPEPDTQGAQLVPFPPSAFCPPTHATRVNTSPHVGMSTDTHSYTPRRTPGHSHVFYSWNDIWQQ